MQASDVVREVFEFRRHELAIVPVLSTLLAGIAFTAASVLVASAERGKLRSYLIVSLTVSTLVLIFATVLDVMILAGMGPDGAAANAAKMQGLSAMSRVAVWSVLLGVLSLFASVGMLGFVHSRRVGVWIAASAGGLLLAFAACVIWLDHVMRLA